MEYRYLIFEKDAFILKLVDKEGLIQYKNLANIVDRHFFILFERNKNKILKKILSEIYDNSTRVVYTDSDDYNCINIKFNQYNRLYIDVYLYFNDIPISYYNNIKYEKISDDIKYIISTLFSVPF